RRSDQPLAVPVPPPLRGPDGRRLAALRRAVRPVQRAQPRRAAQHPERPLAAPLAAALRARRLPLLPRARRPRRAAARPHGDRRGERDHARRRRVAVGAVAMGRLTAADLDAVTIDAYGTLVTVRDPIPALRRTLRARGVERTPEQVAAAFAVEARYYRDRSHEGADEASLALLRRDCAAVFLDALEADLDPEEFARPYVEALEFEPLPGAVRAVAELGRLGLRLASVSALAGSSRGRRSSASSPRSATPAASRAGHSRRSRSTAGTSSPAVSSSSSSCSA